MIDWRFNWLRHKIAPWVPEYVEPPLSFDEFQQAGFLREQNVHPASQKWNEMEWGCALAGEAGELCNYLKKWNRDGGSPELRQSIAKEIGDVIGYADCLATYFGLRTGACVQNKFNEVSRRLHVWDVHRIGDEHIDEETATTLALKPGYNAMTARATW